MKLPTLSHSTYTTQVPSTGAIIEYRPYLVKEEKILLTAQETKSTKEMIKALLKLIDVCTFNAIDVNKLKIFDIEYLFSVIRSKSVGEIAEVTLMCEHCDAKNLVNIPIDGIQVKYPEEYEQKPDYEKKIFLTDKIGIVLTYPTAVEMAEFIDQDTDKFEIVDKTVYACLVNIFDEKEIYKKSDISLEELKDWIGSFNQAQIKQVLNFIENMPKSFIEIEYTCTSCGKKNKTTVEGVSNFFT